SHYSLDHFAKVKVTTALTTVKVTTALTGFEKEKVFSTTFTRSLQPLPSLYSHDQLPPATPS
ncbi:hypothetical protein, partial [Thiolapillus sp.]|uniref:hypothetical protein n=1 Tax=Thiolapillus sp. TaxID=2017437 RepID=UPI003AF8AD3B